MRNLLDIGLGNDFITMTTKPQTKAKINKWDYSNIRVLHSKRTDQNEKATTEWEKIFTNYIYDKRLISKVY